MRSTLCVVCGSVTFCFCARALARGASGTRRAVRWRATRKLIERPPTRARPSSRVGKRVDADAVAVAAACQLPSGLDGGDGDDKAERAIGDDAALGDAADDSDGDDAGAPSHATRDRGGQDGGAGETTTGAAADPLLLRDVFDGSFCLCEVDIDALARADDGGAAPACATAASDILSTTPGGGAAAAPLPGALPRALAAEVRSSPANTQ